MSPIVLFAGRVKGSRKRTIRRVPELIRRLWEKADMETTQVRPWDPAEHLETEEDMARAKGRAEVAQETGMGRENLYKLLSVNDNPEFATVLKVVRALGLDFRQPLHHRFGACEARGPSNEPAVTGGVHAGSGRGTRPAQ